MKTYHDYEYDARIYEFDRKFTLTGNILRRGLRLLLYVPSLLTGYLFAEKFFELENINSMAGLGTAMLVTIALDTTILLLKHWMLRLKDKENLSWLLLFMCCIGFTTVFTALVIKEPVSELVSFFYRESEIISWIIAVVFGCLVYNRYHFFRKSWY